MFLHKATSMNNFCSSCQSPLILIWKKSTRLLTALNMSKHWMIRRLWKAFQVQDLTELWQTACNLGIQETLENEIFPTDSPPAKFPLIIILTQLACQSLTWSNQHSVTTIINNLSIKLYVYQLTSSLNFSSNKDWLYFPSMHVSLVMTIVMLITIPPMSVK